jgi:hypothetical protein
MRIWIVAAAALSGALAPSETVAQPVSSLVPAPCKDLLLRVLGLEAWDSSQGKSWVLEAFDVKNPWPEIGRIAAAHAVNNGMTTEEALLRLMPGVLEASARFDPAYNPANPAPLKDRFKNFIVASASGYAASKRYNFSEQTGNLFSQRAHYKNELEYLDKYNDRSTENPDWNALVVKYQEHRKNNGLKPIADGTAQRRLQKAMGLRDARAPVSIDTAGEDHVSWNAVSNIPKDFSLKTFVADLEFVKKDVSSGIDPRSVVALKLKLFGFSNQSVGRLLGVSRSIPSNIVGDLEQSLAKHLWESALVL